jgi:hypothetical protein
VLTLDRNGIYSGKKPFLDEKHAYQSLSRMSRNFLSALRRRYPGIGSSWAAVVEAHKRGWPHVNLMVYAPALAAQLRFEQERLTGKTQREQILLRDDLLNLAMRHDWGAQSTAEAARNREALSGYLVKLAGVADETTGELAKLSQVPLSAPPRFRRLRSGKGFLSPRFKNPDYTGTMVRRELDPGKAEYGAVALHLLKDHTARAVAAYCVSREGEGWIREQCEKKFRIPDRVTLELPVDILAAHASSQSQPHGKASRILGHTVPAPRGPEWFSWGGGIGGGEPRPLPVGELAKYRPEWGSGDKWAGGPVATAWGS